MNTTPAQETVAQAATDRGALSRHGAMTLIGIMGPKSDLRALFLLRFGKTLLVARGDDTPLGRVSAVTATSVTVQTGGRETTLHLMS